MSSYRTEIDFLFENADPSAVGNFCVTSEDFQDGPGRLISRSSYD
jgi:hypothetical protein